MRRFYSKAAMLALSGAAMMVLSACGGSGGTPTDVAAGEIDSPQLNPSPTLLPAPPAGYVPAYPTEPDAFEGSTGDNNMSTASTAAVGEPLQARSIFPQGDFDWIKVDLEEGVVYDIFTTNLNETGDTYLYLYDDTGGYIDEDDDNIDYDSYIEFNATYTGTFYVMIASYSVVEATSYEFGVRVHADEDNDGYAAVFDCNDQNDTIYPFATEIPGDGIDQDCSGVDAIANGVADPYEVDDDIASAKTIPETTGSYEEIQHRYDVFSQMRTLHDVSDSDYYVYTIPSYSKIRIRIPYDGIVGGGYNRETYDENGTLLSSSVYTNDTGTAQTYYWEVSSDGSGIGWYVPVLIHYGEDRDRDGYYTMDWERDCNDADASIHPYADDSNDTDGIDMNCDGVDGYNSYRP